MLQTNFGTLADEKPGLRPAVQRLKDWVDHHQDWSVLDPRIVAEDLRDVDPLLLTALFWELVNKGFYRRVFMVVTPSGVLADGEYDDPRQIPEKVPDRFHHYFRPDETDIVPVFKPALK
jgi:hypothetical protein